jgi:hypothetical protein
MKNIKTFEQFVNESYSVNEGAVKEFEMGMENLINNIRRGYGWIDPEYVYDAVVNSTDFSRFQWETIKDEVYQQLIDNNLLYYANVADPEVKGKAVTNIKQIQESINESALEIAGGVILGILGLKVIVGIFKAILGKVTLKAVRDPKKLKEISHELSTKAMTEGGKNPLQVALWKNTVDRMIETGEIKNAYDLAKTFTAMDKIDIKKVFESEEFDEIIESKDEYVNATLLDNFKDLRKGSLVKINALDYTQGGDKDTIESIRPDGKKMEIKKAILTVKI